jgi:hypothetical protein
MLTLVSTLPMVAVLAAAGAASHSAALPICTALPGDFNGHDILPPYPPPVENGEVRLSCVLAQNVLQVCWSEVRPRTPAAPSAYRQPCPLSFFNLATHDQACCEKCAGNAKCVAFSYMPDSGVCYLKSQADGNPHGLTNDRLSGWVNATCSCTATGLVARFAQIFVRFFVVGFDLRLAFWPGR